MTSEESYTQNLEVSFSIVMSGRVVEASPWPPPVEGEVAPWPPPKEGGMGSLGRVGCIIFSCGGIGCCERFSV